MFSGSDHFMGMVTPISDMLKILSYPDAVSASDYGTQVDQSGAA